MYMAKRNLHTQSQFIYMHSYTSSFLPESRLQIEQGLCFLCYIFCMAVINFHVFHICGFSTTSCMSSQIQESLIKTNRTHQSDSPFNLTHLLHEEVDIFYFRIVDQMNNIGRQNSKSIYLNPEGDIVVRKGSVQHVYPEPPPTQRHIIGPLPHYEQLMFDEHQRYIYDQTQKDRSEFFNISEDEQIFSLYPLSKSFYYRATHHTNEWQLGPSGMSEDKKWKSQIIAEEMEGFNLVASSNKEDIMETVAAINASLSSDIYVQTRSPHILKPRSFSVGDPTVLDYIMQAVESVVSSYTTVEHFVKSNLVIDNFYAYSQNETLLDLPIEEVRKIPGLKVRYLQVDTKNKCVPIDWFIGYDAFSAYSFINLIGYGPTSIKGFLKPILRRYPNDYKVDFENDFKSVGTQGAGFFSHFRIKSKLLLSILFDLFILMSLTVTVSKQLGHALSKFQTQQVFTRKVQAQGGNQNDLVLDTAQTQSRNQFLENNFSSEWQEQNFIEIQRRNSQPELNPNNINDQVFEVSYKRSITVGLIANLLYCYVLQHILMVCQVGYPNPTVTMAVTVAALTSYNFGLYVLQKTKYRRKLYFSVMLYSFIYMFYCRVYVHSGVLIPTTVYFLRVMQSIVHYKNKFAFQFEAFFNTVEDGFQEVVANHIVQHLQSSVKGDLTRVLTTEMQLTYLRQNHEKKQKVRRERGLSVEEVTDDQLLEQLEETLALAEQDGTQHDLPELKEHEVGHLIHCHVFDTYKRLQESVQFQCPVKSTQLHERIVAEVQDAATRHKELFRDNEPLYQRARAVEVAQIEEQQRQQNRMKKAIQNLLNNHLGSQGCPVTQSSEKVIQETLQEIIGAENLHDLDSMAQKIEEHDRLLKAQKARDMQLKANQVHKKRSRSAKNKIKSGSDLILPGKKPRSNSQKKYIRIIPYQNRTVQASLQVMQQANMQSELIATGFDDADGGFNLGKQRTLSNMSQRSTSPRQEKTFEERVATENMPEILETSDQNMQESEQYGEMNI